MVSPRCTPPWASRALSMPPSIPLTAQSFPPPSVSSLHPSFISHLSVLAVRACHRGSVVPACQEHPPGTGGHGGVGTVECCPQHALWRSGVGFSSVLGSPSADQGCAPPRGRPWPSTVTSTTGSFLPPSCTHCQPRLHQHPSIVSSFCSQNLDSESSLAHHALDPTRSPGSLL